MPRVAAGPILASMDLLACPGCGLELPAVDAPSPAHSGASPACWALYGRLLVREYLEPEDVLLPRLAVAAYAAQHPGRPGQPVSCATAAELIALCLMLEQGATAEQAAGLQAPILEQAPRFQRLERAAVDGTITVADVLAARDPGEHSRLARRWASEVWRSWAPHHAQVRRWIATVGNR